MKKIISIRQRSEDTSKRAEFVRGSVGTVKRKIISTIENDPHGDFDFLLQDEENGKYTRNVEDLYGEVINIMDDSCIAEFTEEDGILLNYNEGALPQQHTVDQLKMVRKISKGTDIGDRISNMNNQGANIHYIKNPIDTGIQSHQDQEEENKKFVPNSNLKNIKSYKTYSTISRKKSKK